MTVPQLAEWYRGRRYQFIAMGEHSQDLTEEKIAFLKELSTEHSDGQFRIFPGIEFTCRGGIHIFAPGTTSLIGETDPVTVAREIRARGGFSILAHPQRLKWNCPPEVLQSVDAVEFWNVAYDGKFLPPRRAPLEFRKMRGINPHLRAIAGHDLHLPGGFYDVAIEMEVSELSLQSVLRVLDAGSYDIRSRFFATDSQARLSWGRAALLRWASWQLDTARRTRSFLQST